MNITRVLMGMAFGAMASFASANLVFNGSFELNTNAGGNNGADDRADGWTNFTDVSALSSPDIWDDAGVDGLAPGSFGFFGHLTAYDGSKMASIASDVGGFSEGVESTAMALVAGTTYRLSVRTAYDSHNGSGYNNPAPLTARLRKGADPSSVLVTFGPHMVDHAWELRTFDFTVGVSDSYSLILSSESTIRNFYVIDDVSVVDIVPEPATLSCLAMGAMALLRRRQRT